MLAGVGAFAGFVGVIATYRVMEIQYGTGLVFGVTFAGAAVYTSSVVGDLIWDPTIPALIDMVLVAVAGAFVGVTAAVVGFKPDLDSSGNEPLEENPIAEMEEAQ